MRVILAEKPSVARDLAQALGCTHKEQGFFRGRSDLITWAIGHLVRFAEPHQMNPAWGKPWHRDVLPMLPGEAPNKTPFLFIPEPRTEGQFRIILRLFHDPRVTSIVNATDAGREGEAIFRRIYALSGSTKPVQRFWTSSLTEEAIGAALQHLRPASDFDALAAAAQARAQLDWLIGMNHSRASTLHNSITCSVGRVQTPTLAMIVRRHHDIAGFIKSSFYEVHAELGTPAGDFIARALNPKSEGKEQKHDFDAKPEAEAILTVALAAVAASTPAHVTAVEIKPRRSPPPQLHNLGELQKEANRRFGLPADRTLAIAQSLYEFKAITYPRSSSRHLSEDMVGSLPLILRAIRLSANRAPSIQQALHRAQHGSALSKRFVDSSKLSDHHAIIPTAKPVPGSLSADDRKVYTLVAERFLAIFLPDKETEETRIDLAIGPAAGATHLFRARGTRLIAPGWTVLHGNQDFDSKALDFEDRQSLPPVKVGDLLPIQDAALVTKERKPPAHYTDATLLAAMETAGRAIEDDELREAMKGRGLGTEATRAAIIQRLVDLDYIIRDGRHFEPTGKGIALIEQVLPHLASPELTGDMETKLGQVESGYLDPATLLAEVSESLRHEIPAVFRSKPMQAPAAPPIARTSLHKDDLLCPKCKAGLVSKRTSTSGKPFFSCARFQEGCNFTINTVVAGKSLSDSHIKDLCSPTRKHQTRLIKGFTSKAGRKFDAFLHLNPANDLRTEFLFDR